MFRLNKTIAYTESWKHTCWIALALGISLPLLLILLEPFDTGESQIPYKNLKLLGYGICVFLPIILLHPLENYLYRKHKRTWYISSEVGYLIIASFIALILCFIYQGFVINPDQILSIRKAQGFIGGFGLPFLPIILPFWFFIRTKFGVVRLPDPLSGQGAMITISGENKSESLTLFESQFIYAQAQQNYVLVHFKEEEGLQKKMIRSTLGKLLEQIPSALKVHRSYVLNPEFVESFKGNTRKREVYFQEDISPIPISQKYYPALQKRLADSSQNLRTNP